MTMERVGLKCWNSAWFPERIRSVSIIILVLLMGRQRQTQD